MLLWETGRESGGGFRKGQNLVPVGEQDLGICAGSDQMARRVPLTHRHTGLQALGNEGRLHGGGDLGGEPGRLCRGPAGGG